MKILQISSYYPPHLGGQEYVVQDLSQQLAANGHDISVLTSDRGGIQGSNVENGVRILRMRSAEFGHAPIMPKLATALMGFKSKDAILHVHIGQAFTPEIVWLMSRLRGFRYVAELHIDFQPSGPLGIFLPLYKKYVLGPVLRSASAVIVLNEKTARLVRRTYGVKSKVVIINNGISEQFFETDRPAPPATPPKVLNLLFVGRLSKQKNVPMLLEALTLTKQPVHLDIIGEGDQRKAIEQYIAEHGLTNVTLHGRLGRNEVLHYYRTSDALVMPSLYEAQPLVLLEAMAARIPIIGTNVIGVADHLWGIGHIVDPSPDALARGIETFCASYDRLPTMVARGAAKAESLRWCNIRKEYETLYQEALTNAA